MRYACLILVVTVGLVFAGCSGSKPSELLETAQFEELQNNKEHARQLYEEIVKKYPESEQAVPAKKKLAELN
jgi:TolA-binding protein